MSPLEKTPILPAYHNFQFYNRTAFRRLVLLNRRGKKRGKVSPRSGLAVVFFPVSGYAGPPATGTLDFYGYFHVVIIPPSDFLVHLRIPDGAHLFFQKAEAPVYDTGADASAKNIHKILTSYAS
jgi:hypothetical protein